MADDNVLAFPWLAAVPETAEGERTTGFAKVQDYLERFGYLATDGVTVGQLDGDTHAALRRFQRFFGLEETGEFDEPTRAAMMRPRCSHPDPEPDDVGFATTCAWERTDLTYALDTGTGDIAGDAEWTAIRNAFRSW